MYELTEIGLVVMAAVILGGLSFVVTAAILAVVEASSGARFRWRAPGRPVEAAAFPQSYGVEHSNKDRSQGVFD